jgi:sugar phosphate isomerase/epimerase
MVTTLSRRSFLGTLAAVGAMPLSAAQTDRYRVGLETYSFHDVDLDTMLKHVGGLGLKFLELHELHLPYDSPPARIAAAKASLARAGITATGVYIHDAFTESEATARPIFEFAKSVGVRYINGQPKREALPLLNRLAREYGIRITIHNHGPKARYETVEDVTSALEGMPNLAACIDIGHFARSRVDPVRAVRALGARAEAIHVKDVDAEGENAIIGKGTIDIPGVFRALRESGFKGLAVLEYEGDFDNMTKRLAGMRESLAAMRRAIPAR